MCIPPSDAKFNFSEGPRNAVTSHISSKYDPAGSYIEAIIIFTVRTHCPFAVVQ